MRKIRPREDCKVIDLFLAEPVPKRLTPEI
jgi:hypothetical protein